MKNGSSKETSPEFRTVRTRDFTDEEKAEIRRLQGGTIRPAGGTFKKYPDPPEAVGRPPILGIVLLCLVCGTLGWCTAKVLDRAVTEVNHLLTE